MNNYKDAPYLLKSIPFNIPAYNNRFTTMFYLTQHSTDYLKYSPLAKAMALFNKPIVGADIFYI